MEAERLRSRARAWLSRWPRMALMLLPLASQLSIAQSATEYQVKAAYIYNFTKFVQWPVQAFENDTSPVRLCVFKDPLFESALADIVKGKVITGRPFLIVTMQNDEVLKNCHVLFVSSSARKKNRGFVEDLRDKAVLTVGEEDGFLEAGGIISFILQGDRVQFQVNHRAASRAGLQISSRLLTVARRVVE